MFCNYCAALNKDEYNLLAVEQFKQSSNMTEQIGAMNALIHLESEAREYVLNAFEEKMVK